MATTEEDKLTIDDLDFDELDFGEESSAANLEELDDPDEDNSSEEEKEEKKDDDKSEEEESEKNEKEDDSDGDENESDESDDKKNKKEPEEAEEKRVVDTVIESLGFAFEEEDLEGIEDSEEGIAKLVEVAGRKAAQYELEQMLEASPHAKTLYEYEKAGGKPEDFIQNHYAKPDYREVEIAEDDVDSQKAVIAQALHSKGFSEERIKRQLEAIEDSGNLLPESQDSLKDLQTLQEQQEADLQKQIADSQADAIKQAEETWEKVDTEINKGKLGNIPLPKTKQKEFRKFLEVDPKTGISPRDEKLNSLSLEEQLAIDAVIFYGLDGLDKIIDRKASTKGANTLRDRLKANKERGKNNTQDPDLEKPSSVEDLEFRIGE